MNAAIVCALNDMNARFYAAVADSFSASRNSNWPGWQRLADILVQCTMDEGFGEGSGGHSYTVLDVACGNLRFEKFLAQALSSRSLQVTALDNCSVMPQLDVPGAHLDFHTLDVVSALLSTEPSALPLCDSLLLGEPGESVAFDLAVSFGFFHHVPGFDLRQKLLRIMIERVRPGGIACVSFWRFKDDPSLELKSHKAREAALATLPDNAAAFLESGDEFLDWQGRSDVFRYCHHFTNEEIDRLLESVADVAETLDVFSADGRTGALNTYVVLRRK